MTTERSPFATVVRACVGFWPEPPAAWSYSSLKELETCPRRWMLSRATYPDLWDGRGYPPLPHPAALFGDIVHGALEYLVKALVATGCDSVGSAAAVLVLKQLGGYTAVIEQVMERRLALLGANPRVGEERLRRIRLDLELRVPDARAQVQAFLSRTELPYGASQSSQPGDEPDEIPPPARGPLRRGAHAEVGLYAPELRMAGRIDLLTVDEEGARITDYKTGAPDPSHGDQLRTYALLWDLDREANPQRLPTTALTAAYPVRPHSYPASNDGDLRNLERELQARIAAADTAIAEASPIAKPSAEACQYCQVRHLCDTYWTEIVPPVGAVRAGNWFDYQGTVIAVNGERSWTMSGVRGGPTVLLRTVSASTDLRVGDGVRVLGARRSEDPESGVTVVEMTTHSELYRLNGS